MMPIRAPLPKPALPTGAFPAALCACLLLAGCGGGSSDGSVASILTPTSTTASNSSLQGTLVSERFPSFSNRLQISTATTGAITNANTSVTAYGTVQIAYNATTNSYTLSDSGTTTATVFTPADATAATAAFRHYKVGTDELSLLVNATTNPRVNLSYVTYGIWSGGAGVAGGTANYRLAVAGVQTPYGNVPRTGTGSYSGIVDGYWVAGGVNRRLLGSTGTFTADFATGQVASALVLSGTGDLSDAGGGARTALGTYTGVGNIATGTNQFGGNLNPVNSATVTSDSTYSGSYNGAFFGPGATEVGLNFNLQSGANTGGVVSGVMVGRGTIAVPAATTTPTTATTGG